MLASILVWSALHLISNTVVCDTDGWEVYSSPYEMQKILEEYEKKKLITIQALKPLNELKINMTIYSPERTPVQIRMIVFRDRVKFIWANALHTDCPEEIVDLQKDQPINKDELDYMWHGIPDNNGQPSERHQIFHKLYAEKRTELQVAATKAWKARKPLDFTLFPLD